MFRMRLRWRLAGGWLSAILLAVQPAVAGNGLTAFLDSRTEPYQQALARARQWVEALDVNPLLLRQHGVKGKKKVAEWLDAMLRIHAAVDADTQTAIGHRIAGLATMTRSPGYHDMGRVSDRQFHQDATSYLRAAYLLDKFGIDTTLYQREIGHIKARLDAHMPQRGVDQRMAFHEYYSYFGLTEPFPLAAAFEAGVIAERQPAAWYRQHPRELYHLTHEIFVPYDFGAKLEADFFSTEDKAYLRPLLVEVTAWSLANGDVDISAELASCLRYLRFHDEPIYRQALDFLLAAQWPAGCWGNYEGLRPRYGRFVEQGFYLHTTLVALDALISAFHTRPDSGP